MSSEEIRAERDDINRVLHELNLFHGEPCRSACTHIVTGQWTCLGAANVLARSTDDLSVARRENERLRAALAAVSTDTVSFVDAILLPREETDEQ